MNGRTSVTIKPRPAKGSTYLSQASQGEYFRFVNGGSDCLYLVTSQARYASLESGQSYPMERDSEVLIAKSVEITPQY